MKTTNFGTMLLCDEVSALVTPLPGQTFYKKLLEVIRNANFTIDIMQYQWMWYSKKPKSQVQILNQLLLERARAGVKVRVILNKEGRGQALTAINQETQKYLGEAGVVCKLGRIFPINHAKMWLVDDQITIVGSHNISNRAFTVNNEVSILIKSSEVTTELRRYYEEIFKVN